ncbi:MAG: hypothetical protein HY699_12505 [Deltaproteobacteria bacterium]|nr:hypothetical protein [Deltaproteobacteria bacterium]
MSDHPAQVAAWLAATATFLVTALKVLAELRQSREQRQAELRWKQAEAGKALNDEMQTDERAWPAMQMLDSDQRTFNVGEDVRLTVTQADIRAALDPGTESTAVVEFIRDCFDTWFYFLAMLDHYIDTGLIRPEDVAYPTEYYVPLLARHRLQVDKYLAHYGLSKVQGYLRRHPEWGQTDGAAA